MEWATGNRSLTLTGPRRSRFDAVDMPALRGRLHQVIPDYRGSVEPPDFNRQPDRAKLEQVSRSS